MGTLDETNVPVVAFNFGLSWKQITAGFTGLVALMGAGATAGWMTIPYANKTDVKVIEQSVNGMRKDIGDLQTVTVDLTDALRELQTIVSTLKARRGGQASPELLPTRKPVTGTRKRLRPPDAWREGRKVPAPPSKSAWSPFQF